MPALNIVGDFHACGEQSRRHPHKQWTGWETSAQAMDGTPSRLLCTSWETSTPIVDDLGDFSVTSPSHRWCLTITFVENSISLCC